MRPFRLPLWIICGAACCGDSSPEAPPAPTIESVRLVPATDTIAIGGTRLLSAIAVDGVGSTVSSQAVTWTSGNPAIATVSNGGNVRGVSDGNVTITATAGGKQGAASITVQAVVASVEIAPTSAEFPVRQTRRLVAVVKDASGAVLDGRTVQWSSSRPTVATVDSTGLVTALLADTVTISATSGIHSGAARIAISPSSLPVRGLYVYFENRGSEAGFALGDVLQNFDSPLHGIPGMTINDEVALELGLMRGMGVNTITIDLWTADSLPNANGHGIGDPPQCNVTPQAGMRWPQPTPTEVTNLIRLFDLIHANGLRVMLRLVNLHMEEQPPTQSATWLGAILRAIGTHPALDVVMFEGSTKLRADLPLGSPVECGVPAEPPLWLGPGSLPVRYIQWAIDYARSLGVPTIRLSAEAIVGDFWMATQGGNHAATDGHNWDPAAVLKGIFDALQIPDSTRTYAISLYEHRKCAGQTSPTCVDTDPETWAGESLTRLFAVVGPGSRARVIAGEMGNATPVEGAWTTEQALRSLMTQMRRHGVDGGSFWLWVNFSDFQESDPTLAQTIKRRGVPFTYNPVQRLLAELYQSP